MVESVDVAGKGFSVKSGKEEMTFSLSDKTKITGGQKTLALAELKKGQEVTVEYAKEGNRSVADMVSVSASKTSSHQSGDGLLGQRKHVGRIDPHAKGTEDSQNECEHRCK